MMKLILSFWLLLVSSFFLHPLAEAAQGLSTPPRENQRNIAYDAITNSVVGYDGAPVLASGEKNNGTAGDSVLFDKFAGFLAAETLPELEISASKYPELAENILNAQKAGHPEILTHGGDIAANRAAALDGVPKIKPFSRDEYPFASSMEGGGWFLGGTCVCISTKCSRSIGEELLQAIQYSARRPVPGCHQTLTP